MAATSARLAGDRWKIIPFECRQIGPPIGRLGVAVGRNWKFKLIICILLCNALKLFDHTHAFRPVAWKVGLLKEFDGAGQNII